jgi:hypothetical protein
MFYAALDVHVAVSFCSRLIHIEGFIMASVVGLAPLPITLPSSTEARGRKSGIRGPTSERADP